MAAKTQPSQSQQTSAATISKGVSTTPMRMVHIARRGLVSLLLGASVLEQWNIQHQAVGYMIPHGGCNKNHVGTSKAPVANSSRNIQKLENHEKTREHTQNNAHHLHQHQHLSQHQDHQHLPHRLFKQFIRKRSKIGKHGMLSKNWSPQISQEQEQLPKLGNTISTPPWRLDNASTNIKGPFLERRAAALHEVAGLQGANLGCNGWERNLEFRLLTVSKMLPMLQERLQ